MCVFTDHAGPLTTYPYLGEYRNPTDFLDIGCSKRDDGVPFNTIAKCSPLEYVTTPAGFCAVAVD